MLEKLFPTKYHMALKWLSSKNWLEIGIDPESGSWSKVKTSVQIDPNDYQQYAKVDIDLARELLNNYCTANSSSAFYVLTLSKAIANGPKLFRPTFQQCVALENTEIRVPFDFYQQPYPTVILEIPKEYRQRIAALYNTTETPQYVLVHKDENTNVIAVSAWFSSTNLIVNILGPRGQFKSIEDALVFNRGRYETDKYKFDMLKDQFEGTEIAEAIDVAKNITPEPERVEYTIAELVQRLGMNFSLMMTMLGVKIGEPVNSKPQHVEKQQKILHRKDSSPEDKQRARKLLASTVFLVEFEQNINFYETETEHKTEDHHDGHSGKTIKPHWRKGHFKMQPHGPIPSQMCSGAITIEGIAPHHFKERSPEQCREAGIQHGGIGYRVMKCQNCETYIYRKLVFIKPVLVRKDFFVGDISNTSVTYTPKG